MNGYDTWGTLLLPECYAEKGGGQKKKWCGRLVGGTCHRRVLGKCRRCTMT